MKAISLKNVTKIYKQGAVEVLAVNNISLEVDPGEFVLIMGPSGSGKTTLLSIIGCILKPTNGEVYIRGENCTNLDESQLPKIRKESIGFIFQTFNLFNSLTARQNVEVPLNLYGISGGQAFKRSMELIEKVGLAKRAKFIPSDLSGGEKQRVSIARALANNPPIILADEPTGMLDSKTGQNVMEILKSLACHEKRCVVVVTHDLRAKSLADRVLELEDGALKN